MTSQVAVESGEAGEASILLVGSNSNKIPISLSETGLSQSLLEDMVARKLFDLGACGLLTLSEKSALSSRVLEAIMSGMRADMRVELLGPEAGSSATRYRLTDAGRKFAGEAYERSGYSGPAPISYEHYTQLIRSQSVRNLVVTRDEMAAAYSDVVIKPQLLDRLGSAMHSGKAIFIYGPAGTGKTFLCSRLIRLLRTPVLIPYAISVGDSIVRVFDPAVHTPVDTSVGQTPWLAERQDPRLILCQRPFIVSGGELTMDLLEIQRDTATRQYLAPLQMKATHGIYMVDDLGRQRMSTDALFNRWIVPMESGVDYLNMDSGARLKIPFDVILIFSTNMQPEDLDDPAFQRRIGHKIGFDYADDDSYLRIWSQECERLRVTCSRELVQFVMRELHDGQGVPKLACHPRDLIGMALDYSRYSGEPDTLTQAGLVLAWDNYFARAVEAELASERH